MGEHLRMVCLRVGMTLQSNPWARAGLGLLAIAGGVVLTIVGGTHGRLLVLGVVLLAGGLGSGLRGLRGPGRGPGGR